MTSRYAATLFRPLLVSGLASLLSLSARAQPGTMLRAGDLVFTGVNASDGSEFTFAPLVDLDAGTQISFTDNGWQATGGFWTGEGTVTYTAPGFIPRGTLLHYDFTQPTPDFQLVGGFELDPQQDQLLAYQADKPDNPIFLAAIMLGGKWDDATSDKTSAMPNGLVKGSSALVLEMTNAYMNRSDRRRGPVSALRAWFNAPDFWTGDSQQRQSWLSQPPFDQDLVVEDGVVPDAVEWRALHALYTGTTGAGWSHANKWPVTDPDWAAPMVHAEPFKDWYGVTITNGDITALDLSNNGLTGTFPDSLGLLTQLQSLRLNDNALNSGLPAPWNQLTQLQVLNLGNNHGAGPLPADIAQWAQLQYLDVSGNRFDSTLPAGLGQCRQLLVLAANGNAFTGTVPASLGRLAALQSLDLGENQLSGALPDSLARLKFLSVLRLANNQFSGTIPAGWGQLGKLTALRLEFNQLTGTVPTNLTGLPYLAAVGLAHNHLSGSIPVFPGTVSSGFFYLSDNDFTGLAAYWGNANASHATMLVDGNRLDFAALEPNFVGPGQHPFATFVYTNQRVASALADTVQYLRGGTIQLARQLTGTRNSLQWEREVGGLWTNMPGATASNLTIAAATEAHQGRYRLGATNAWVTGLTLYAQATYADLIPYTPLPENRPVDASAAALATAFAPGSRSGATDTVNFVRTYTGRIAYTNPLRLAQAVVDSVQVSTAYVDGLGRPLQTVLRQESPGRRDLVQPLAYDALGRQARQYLPYVAPNPAGTAGDYRPDAVYDQYHFYRDNQTGPGAATDGVVRTGVPYSETGFEASPLSRPLVQAAPGESWQMATAHVVSQLERSNAATDSVQYWVPGQGTNANDLAAQAGGYSIGALWGSQTTDEHGYRTLEWKDELGQTVLKQVEIKRIKNNKQQNLSRWLRTYYVYDDFGHLRAVLPPEAVKALQANGWAMTPAAEKLVFRYRYNAQGAIVAKQVPGTEGETWLVYDQLNRPVLSQDAAQRLRNEWAYTKYDALGRPVLTGLVTRPAPLASLQAEADAALATAEQRSANLASYPHGYTTDQAYPSLGQQGFGAGEVLSVTNYDDYNFDNDAQGTPEAAYDTQLDAQLAVAPTPDFRVTGLVTRQKTRVLGLATTAPNAWLTNTTFYDDRARPVQVQGTNARGGQDLVTSQLDFTGKVVKSVALHHGPNLPAAGLQVAETMQYDHAGRLLATRQQLPGEAQPVPVARLTYNELGQLTRKTIGTGKLTQNVDYRYNVRGWLTHLNDPALQEPSDLFGLELCYESSFTAGYEQYNGNLTGQKWRSQHDQTERAYGYVYDRANRLLQGDYVARAGTAATAPWTAEVGNYRLSFVSYDDNGNILTLRRRGLLANATRSVPKQYGPVDLLAYRYDGNRLTAVDDQVTTNELPRLAGYHGAPASLAGDFQEQGVRQSQEYYYDANGNLTQDRNKGITGIAYNHLNLPKQIHFGTGADSLVFRYSAGGQKLGKLVYQTGKPTLRTDYLGPYQYEGDSLRFFPHAEGRVLRFVSGTSGAVRYQREYTVKDHLGNLRLAYRAGQRRSYSASLEPGAAARETAQFDAQSVSPPVAQNVNVGGVNRARTGDFVARLNAGGTAPQPLGPLTQLAVQKGDTVTVVAPGYYPQATSGNSFAFSLASFVANLLAQQPPAPVGTDGRSRPLPLLSIGVSTGLPALSQLGGGVPKGYVRLLVFDADSNLVSSQGQVQQLSSAAHTGYEPLTVQVIVQQDGYVTAYVGNESNTDVYFDDVTIEHRQGLQVQENQYDPWGLGLAGINYQTSKLGQLNHFGFNSIEHNQDLGINVNTAFYRVLDYQLGRWWQVDPKYNYQESPYTAMANNPIRYSDPLGDIIQFSFKDGFLGLFGNKHTVQYNNGGLTENGHAYMGKISNFVTKATNALNTISSESAGKAGVDKLVKSNSVFDIKRGRNHFVASSQGAAGLALQPGFTKASTNSSGKSIVGSGGTIFWSPSNNKGGPDVHGNTSRPSFIGMAHEMGHAISAEAGTADYAPYAPLHVDTNLRGYTKNDLAAMDFENQVRSSVTLPLREMYGKDSSGGDFMRALNPGTSINSQTGYDYSIDAPTPLQSSTPALQIH